MIIYDPVSLYEPIYHDGGDAIYVMDQVSDNKNTDESWLENISIKEAMKKYKGVYFGAIGGAGAIIASCIKSCEVIAYEDLGPEAVRRLVVEDLPLTVVIDSEGHDLYEIGRQDYLKGKE